jgi:two-component system, OmpR family, sensor kinase
MTLQRRLMLSVTGVTATALVVSFVIVFLQVQRDELLALDHDLLTQAHVALLEMDAGDPPGVVVPEGTTRVPESLSPTTRYMAVYDAMGAPIATSGSFGGSAPRLADIGINLDRLSQDGLPADLDVEGQRLRGVVIPFGDEGESLLYAASRRTITEDTRFLLRLLSVLLVAALVGTALVARWLGKLLARDVQAIAVVARSVAGGDLEARAGTDAGRTVETRALAADLDEMIERLSTLVRAQRDFIAHAAHELRSPLATLRGELQLALRRPREPEEYRRALGEVLEDVETLSRLTDDLLALARAQSAGAAMMQRADVADVLENAVSMARGLAEDEDVTIEVAEGGDSALVMGASGELARALRNLIDNAIGHSPAGGIVTVGWDLEDERITLWVADQGTGVRPDEQARIFAPFFRGRATSSDRPGAGLGLAIARGIAEGCGGTVTLDATVKVGARFALSLRRASPDEAT